MSDINKFSFEIITEPDGTIRLANQKFDELPWGVVHFLMCGLLSGAKEYNEKIKERNKEGYREREMEIMRQALATFEDDAKKCADFLYLSDIPKTAKEIEEQCIFLWPKKEEV